MTSTYFNSSVMAAVALMLVACGSSDNGSKKTAALDVTAPKLVELSQVPSSRFVIDDALKYRFSSTEAGKIAWTGGCNSVTTEAVVGENTLVLKLLAAGYFDQCTLTVTDAAGNVSNTLHIAPFLAGKPLNDTGITLCGDMALYIPSYTENIDNNNDVDCLLGASPSSTATQHGVEIANGLNNVPAGQDAHFGRDANPATNSDADGHKGFSFTKLSANDGAVLVNQYVAWSDEGSEIEGSKWGCVQDNVTRLVWEAKTNDGGLRDKDWTYSWYNSDNTLNGGKAGTADGGNNCAPYITRCDTEKYVADVNAVGLCGKSDWRMPTPLELLNIVSHDGSEPRIDRHYFPNTLGSYYWTSATIAKYTDNVLVVTFLNGALNYKEKSNQYSVRLVRGGQ